MSDRYAVVSANNVALNFILWDGISEFDYGQDQGNYLVQITDGMSYGFGWIWDGTSFIDPSPPPPDPPAQP